MFTKIRMILIAMTVTMTIATSGCMKAKSALEEATQKAANSIGCTNMKSLVFDSMYSYLDTENAAPSLEEFTTTLNSKIDTIAQKQNISDQAGVEELKNNLSELYQTLIEQSVELKETKTAKEHLQTMIELEMHDVSTQANVYLNAKVASQFSKVESSAQSLSVECSASTPATDTDNSTNSGTDSSNSNNTSSYSTKATSVIIGSHNVFATAYQSCKVLSIDEITASTANVKGITRLAQNHPDGVGGKRVVSTLSDVQQTHPYIKVSGQTTSNTCFSVYNNPLIYDYGGSPSVSNNIINLFKDAGSGTEVLGVDCSAYVSAAVAAAGLKYRPDTDNKAIYTRQTSSKFVNAAKSGFTCFENVTMTPNTWLKSGDIMGISGHVIIVDRVGKDPFGFLNYTSESDCSKITVSQFDFSISQSSPSKNGIGLNRYVAKDYLANEAATMKTGFVSFAKAACKAYFTQKNVATESSTYGLLRHKGTSECLATRVELTNQSCVQSCLQ